MKEMKQTICARCGKPATVYYRESVNGKTREMHLCAACAAREGAMKDVSSLTSFFDDDFFHAIPLFSDLLGAPTQVKSARCPRCGKTARQIREDGRFGCSQCYETFGKELDLKSFIGNGYRGEPLTAAGEKTRPEREESGKEKIERLKAELKKALSEEAYERAAALRDEIRSLEGK